jgi:hypothetical protein
MFEKKIIAFNPYSVVIKDCCGRYRMVVGFTTTCAYHKIESVE